MATKIFNTKKSGNSNLSHRIKKSLMVVMTLIGIGGASYGGYYLYTKSPDLVRSESITRNVKTDSPRSMASSFNFMSEKPTQTSKVSNSSKKSKASHKFAKKKSQKHGSKKFAKHKKKHHGKHYAKSHKKKHGKHYAKHSKKKGKHLAKYSKSKKSNASKKNKKKNHSAVNTASK